MANLIRSQQRLVGEMVSLNRLQITGPLTDDTPRCVIFQIAKTLSFEVETKLETSKYDKQVIDAIINFKTPIIVNKTSPTQELASLIARYVNEVHSLKWNIRQLMTAYNHLQKYLVTFKPEIPESEFQVGSKTNLCPMSFDACMLYRICNYNGIKTSRSMTIEQMAYAVKMLSSDIGDLRDKLADLIRFLSKSQLISLSLQQELKVAPEASIPQETNTPSLPIPEDIEMTGVETVDSEKTGLVQAGTDRIWAKLLPNLKLGTLDQKVISSAYTRLTDPNHALTRITPTTHEEAIILSALVYGINLTETLNPQSEYIEMKRINSYIKENRYIPVHDKLFRSRYIVNPMWYDVRRTWTPQIPELYTPDLLLALARAEGYQGNASPMGNFADAVGQNPLEFLEMSRLTSTFYLGIHPYLIKDDMKEDSLITVIERENACEHGAYIVSFGNVGCETFELYTIQSLTEFFRITKKFVIPSKPLEQLSDSAIIKLKNICGEFVRARARLPIPPADQPPVNRALANSAMDAIHVLAGFHRSGLGGFPDTIIAISRILGGQSPMSPFHGQQSFHFERVTPDTLRQVFGQSSARLPQARPPSVRPPPEELHVNDLIDSYQNLLDAIEEVERLNIATSAHAHLLRQAYDGEHKTIIARYLSSLLHVGLYMRGWKVAKSAFDIDINVLPIRRDQTGTLASAQGAIDYNVTESIKAFEAVLASAPQPLVPLLRGLPLMMKTNAADGSVKFNASTSIDDGLTILDRIAICKDGTSMLACIRTSSNHFIASAYYYMVGCGIETPFKIEDCDYIS